MPNLFISCVWRPNRVLILLVSFLVATCAFAQIDSTQSQEQLPESLGLAPMQISGVATVFPDQLSQWDIFDWEGERAGYLNLRFPEMTTGTGDLTQWVFRMGDYQGMIRPKIRGKTDLWEVRVNGHVVILRPLFPNRYDQWSIHDREQRIVYQLRDYATLEYWSTRESTPGLIEIYTRFEGDPTDWEMYDQSFAEISAAAQLAMLWLPIYIRLTTN